MLSRFGCPVCAKVRSMNPDWTRSARYWKIAVAAWTPGLGPRIARWRLSDLTKEATAPETP